MELEFFKSRYISSCLSATTAYITVNKCGYITFSRFLTKKIDLQPGDYVLFSWNKNSSMDYYIIKTPTSEGFKIRLIKNRSHPLLCCNSSSFASSLFDLVNNDNRLNRFKVSLIPESTDFGPSYHIITKPF